jgi:hypothetical protein
MDSARLQPALLGGLLIGVLSALPLVSAGNCCCCLWVVSGGALAAYLRQQNLPVQISASEGAIVGLLAGLIGGVATTIISIPMEMAMGPLQRQFLERILSSNPDFPPELRDMIERGAASGAAVAIKLVVNLVTGVVFGLLGGLLGAAIFKKNVPPPPPGTVEVLPPQ